MIKIDIDGKELDVEKGRTIIEAADQVGIEIPRFCYHKKLSIAANCRMCLVEVKGAPKPLPACATPVTEGMQVQTKSPIALMAQRSVMEFLLINHPLDCPICDQGGECELQDVSLGYGEGVSQYNQGKRAVKDENVGPLIATGMTRCIHCTRCVRFGDEVAGMKELGAVGRGEHTEIRTFINNSIDSELSGNLIDVCPVGALTSKPYRFSARAWELQQHSTIAAHDPVGSNIYTHSLRNKIKRIVPKENEAINEVWLSDRDRFSYEGLSHTDRVLQPKVRIDGELKTVEWELALAATVDAIKTQAQQNPEHLITLISPNSTTEEGYLLQKLVRGLGSDKIDYRLNSPHDFDLGTNNTSLSELEKADMILMVGAAPRKSMPLLNHRIRKAFLNKAKIFAINPVGSDWNYSLELEHIVPAESLLSETAELLKALQISKGVSITEELKELNTSDTTKAIAAAATQAEKVVIILGDFALSHPDSVNIHNMIMAIQETLSCGTIVLSKGANSQGLKLAGAFPHDNNSSAEYLIDTAFNLPDGLGTYILFNIEPELDCQYGDLALEKLRNANKVICISPYLNDEMLQYADIVLPLAVFTETSGTFVNIDHVWQSFRAVVNTSSPAENNNQVRPGWRIICALAHLLEVKKEEFLFASSLDVKQEILELVQKGTVKNNKNQRSGKITTKSNCDFNKKANNGGMVATLVSETNCYHIDNIVRRAASLQQTTDAKHHNFLYISKNIAEKLQLRQDDSLTITNIDDINKVAIKPLIIDNKLPDNTVYMTTNAVDGIAKPYSQVVLFNGTEIK